MTRPALLSPADAMFVYGESRDAPQHVGSLLRFGPPPDVTPNYLRDVFEAIKSAPDVVSPWNRRLATPWFQHSPVHAWVVEPDFDIEYHVRRTAVPAPGDERELGTLIARLHASPIDLSKPPWEVHLIEGLHDGGFAMFCKVHHSLVDGYTMTRALEQTFSSSPGGRENRLFFNVPIDTPAPDADGLWANPASFLRASARDATSALALTRALARLTLRRGPLVGSMEAPDTILNRRITRNRRFATQRYPLAQLKGLAKSGGATLNDVVLAVCGGGLRAYLLEQNALPDRPLVAFVPVNVRPKGDPGGGNAVGAMLASLATDVADPVERLRAVTASTTEAKKQLDGMTKDAVIAYSQALLAPAGLQTLSAITGLGRQPRTFNVTISNVPGPAQPLYFAGSRLEASYPASIVGHGMGLNITLFSYAGEMGFGFTGCRDTVPHLQRLAVHTGAAVAELEAALDAAT